MVVKTTLGELISTIDTELDKAQIHNQRKRKLLMALILNDMLTHGRGNSIAMPIPQ
jgi:hypothetical protein